MHSMRPAGGASPALDLERSHMHRKLWLSAVMAALGALLLVVAGFAHAASSSAAKKGGTMRLNMSATDVDFSDPSLAYGTISWQIEYATALKLVNYPDKAPPLGGRLRPEAATGLPIVSRNGRQYTFTIRSGLRFSNGAKVTAANSKRAIDRTATRGMQSPATPFMDSIAGYTAALNKGGNANVSGVIARGNKLIIRLNRPDGGMLAKLGMPFFQALPLNIADDRHGNIDTFDITVNTNLDQSLLQVRSGQVDYDMGGLPPTAHADLAKRYGVNKGQYQVHQLVETDYVALNTSPPTFASTKLRK